MPALPWNHGRNSFFLKAEQRHLREEWNGGEPVYPYTRISEEQRLLAQRLWNEYNETLAQHGMKLHYDVSNGGFFVASTDLENGMLKDGKGATPDDLDADELEQVVNDGGFDGGAVNNPLGSWISTITP